MVKEGARLIRRTKMIIKDIYNLYTQRPKPSKQPIKGRLEIDRKGDAYFWTKEGTECAKNMARIRIEYAEANGIKLNGLEPSGFDQQRQPKYNYQEWWLMYL
jgi:hypothetical protein